MKPDRITEEVIEKKEEEPVDDDDEEIDIFSIEEAQAMQTLADMGRLFNDEDEARMVKLTEDLTAWINKYAPTMDDPESLLLDVASSLITDEMKEYEEELEEALVEEIPEEAVVEAIEVPELQVLPPPPAQSTITISFSFGDNSEWFSFE